jgi:hypothetical protein
MRSTAFAVAMVLLATDLAAAQPSAVPSKKATEVFDAAKAEQMKCLTQWTRRLSASADPIEHVAVAILGQCSDQAKALNFAARNEFPNAPVADVVKTFEEAARKAIISNLIQLRMKAKSGNAALSTGSITSDTSDEQVKPMTREGAIADCDIANIEYRKWVAERGNARVDMIEDRARLDTKCRAEAKKLPTAFDYHTTKN